MLNALHRIRRIGKKKIFIWDSEPVYEDGYQSYRYSIGAVMYQTSDELPPDMKKETRDPKSLLHTSTIPGGKYAVFSTLDKTDRNDPEEAFRLLIRHAFGGWINENRFRVDMRKRTFVLWNRENLYFYVPVVR